MARYVGARYVPIFYENSLDGSTQWEPNVVYDPLVWVTLTNGHMYLSKKKVPATVGIPSANVDYWLDVAQYNGFIQDLDDRLVIVENDLPGIHSDISDLQTEVSDIRAGVVNLVMFGDSWLASGGWGTGLASRLHAAHSWNFGVNGAGFARAGYPTFSAQLTTAGTTLTDDEKTSVTHVVLGGGINDYGESVTDLTDAVTAFFLNCRTMFPNAKIYFFNNHGRAKFTRDYFNRIQSMREFALIQGVICLTDIEFSMMGAPDYYMQSDDVHPTAQGFQMIAENVYEAMNGQTYAYLDSGSYLSGGIISSNFKRIGSIITCSGRITPTGAGQYTDGLKIGEIPIGVAASTKIVYNAPLFNTTGSQIGTILVAGTTNYRGDIKVYGVGSGVSAPSNFTFSIDLVGALD